MTAEPIDRNFPMSRERTYEQGVHRPVAVHEGLLVTTVPFPVEIGLKQVVEL